MTETTVSAPPMYQLKITLQGSDPAIWRRVLVPPDIPLGTLNRVIQLAMGWENYHWHEFAIGKRRYTLPLENTPDFWQASLCGGPIDERKVQLNQLVPEVARAFSYQYDFGDAWVHEILFEEIVPSPQPETIPTCMGGQRACPPEDCGGIDEYNAMLKVLNKPRRNRDRRRLIEEWFDEEFDPHYFDANVVNAELHALPIIANPFPI